MVYVLLRPTLMREHLASGVVGGDFDVIHSSFVLACWL